ncbi:methyltransferase [Actinoplanes sp. NPDC049265]|uniref:methyltransferase n=1 Tax=Actinoplanes sp. NPDC049265 TaxID=3363902 RepID=UPI003714469C
MTDDMWAVADLVTPMAVRVAATLRLADHIAAGEHSPAALAAAVGADPDALERVMAHLVTAGILTPSNQLTALGEKLRSDHPEQMRAWLDIEGSVGRAELSFVSLLHTVRTGEAAFPQLYGRDFWTDMAADPARAASFDALMGGRLEDDAAAVAAAYPWEPLGHLVDVGGGNGTLLIAILREHPSLRGTVVDLAGPVARATAAIAEAGLADRATAVEGSFFDPLPPNAGGYLLSGVLHDWDDASAARILRQCAAAGPAGKVIVVEDNMRRAVATSGDLRMLCYVRGRDRTLDQMRELARSAGLAAGPVTPGGTRLIAEYSVVPVHVGLPPSEDAGHAHPPA